MNSMRRLTLPQRYNLATKRLEGRYVRFDVQPFLTYAVLLIYVISPHPTRFTSPTVFSSQVSYLP